MGMKTGEWVKTHLGANVAALGPQLVDLGLSDVGPLLCLIQFVLHFAELGQVGVGLLLLEGLGRPFSYFASTQ